MDDCTIYVYLERNTTRVCKLENKQHAMRAKNFGFLWEQTQGNRATSGTSKSRLHALSYPLKLPNEIEKWEATKLRPNLPSVLG